MLIVRLIDLYSIVVLVAVVLFLVQLDRGNPLVGVVGRFTEPVLGPIRRALPPMGGLDLSPMLLLLGLQVLKGLFR